MKNDKFFCAFQMRGATMIANENLFGNYKSCEGCGKALPIKYKGELCPNCIEQQLFHEVKEYIRENDVTEYDVAAHFDIPLMRVKQWIREGRIEYKDNHLNSIKMHCAECGAPIVFGTLCTKCQRKHNMSVHATAQQASDAGRMRYIEDRK